jgi:hypothetical protein
MTEDFLHFVWQYQYLDTSQELLQTTEGQDLLIFRTGQPHQNEGADFLDANIMLDGVQWVGTVEIHLKSSDWLRHHHSTHPRYENVILHVVWEDDQPVFRNDGTRLPTLAIKERIYKRALERYYQLLSNQEVIPCAKQFPALDNIKKIVMLDRALTHRLEQKANQVQMRLEENEGDWEETTYQLLAQNFGFKINSEPLGELSRRLPLKYIRKHADNTTQLEALLFGQAGFLEKAAQEDDYITELRREYQFLAQKYQLRAKQIPIAMWSFLRLRPANFPTVRLAQFAAYLQAMPTLFSFFLQTDTQKLKKRPEITTSVYWQQHYQLGKKSTKPLPQFGQSAWENILINTAVPLLAGFAKVKQQQEPLDKALKILEMFPAEVNHITQIWETLGLRVRTAFDTQALIEQYNHFCTKKKCLQCSIGIGLVK